jgi:hypothetical protein
LNVKVFCRSAFAFPAANVLAALPRMTTLKLPLNKAAWSNPVTLLELKSTFKIDRADSGGVHHVTHAEAVA